VGREDGEAVGADPEEAVAPGAYLNWAGRRDFRARIPAPHVLERVADESDPAGDTPSCLVIDGDNLKALVSLHGQYAAAVDVVVIDPPYNTGKSDFRYSDRRFRDPNADADDGDFVSAQDGGRHTKWLNFMAPRLLMIRELMASHGVIFVHISDVELPRLLLLMETIFGEANHLGTIVWKSATDNNPSQIVVEHEYIACFAKNRDLVPSSWRGQLGQQRQMLFDAWTPISESRADLDERRRLWTEFLKANKAELGSYAGNYRHVDERGPFMTADLSFPGGGGPSYDVVHPATNKPTRVPPHGYRVTEDVMRRLVDEDRIHYGKDERSSVLRKLYLSEVTDDPLRSVIASFGGKGVNADLKRLFPDKPDVFPNPKPTALEEYLLSFTASRDALVLDCFAGSGTTGHAVWRLNKRDAGSRRFILVEEGNGDDLYAAELTAERLRRARDAEHLSGSFAFYRVGEVIDREAFATFQRLTIIEAVRQADATGRAAGIRPIDGRLVIGANRRNQAICLGFIGEDGGTVTADMLGEMFIEAKELGLERPLRVYGAACGVIENESEPH
jgi:adenine-specific DNA-methyltransferase